MLDGRYPPNNRKRPCRSALCWGRPPWHHDHPKEPRLALPHRPPKQPGRCAAIVRDFLATRIVEDCPVPSLWPPNAAVAPSLYVQRGERSSIQQRPLNECCPSKAEVVSSNLAGSASRVQNREHLERPVFWPMAVAASAVLSLNTLILPSPTSIWAITDRRYALRTEHR